MAKSLKISRNLTIGIVAIVIVVCLFIFYKKEELFSTMYDESSVNPIGVSRPNGFEAVKIKTTSSDTVLSYCLTLSSSEKQAATDETDNLSTGTPEDQLASFLICLKHIIMSIVAKSVSIPLNSITSSIETINELQPIEKVKCRASAALGNNCVLIANNQEINALKLDRNPIDSTRSSIAKEISDGLGKVFQNANALLVNKILESENNGATFLDDVKDEINDFLEHITNLDSDAFYIYYRVDYDLDVDNSDHKEKIKFKFVENDGEKQLSTTIAGFNDGSTTQELPEAPVVDVDCEMNFPPFGQCIENQDSICIPTPHIPGQFGTKLGTQERTSFIDIQPRGNGRQCPLPQTEEKQCYIPCENPILDEPLEEMFFSDFKNKLMNNLESIRADVYRSRDDAQYLNNSLGIITLSVDSNENLVRSNIPNKIVQDCNNFNISTLYLRTFEDDGNYTKDLVIVNPKTELCTGQPHQRSNLEGSLCSDSCTFIKRSSEDYDSCLTRCTEQCSLACCQSACYRSGAFIEPFTSGSSCSFQPYGNTLSECKENCKNDGCQSETTCGEICGNCSSISCRWTLPDFNGTSEKPTAPNIIATPGNNSATIIWNRSDDRGSRIERYIVTAYETTNPENGVRIELSTNPSCTNCIHRMESLKNNVSYTIGVSAVNNGGVSRMSNTVVVIPSTTSVDMNFVQSIQKDAVANIYEDKDMLKGLIDKVVLQRGNVDDQTLSDLLSYRNKPEQNTLKDLLSKMAGSTIEITI